MKIPKIIHYCWFGSKKIPEKELKCIDSWKKFLPDYKFKLWNEENFDLTKNTFALQAYDAKYYAFVSDYVRTKVLYHHGGLYLDTDVELLPKFKSILQTDKCLLGFETRSKVGTAVMRFWPNHKTICSFLKFYDSNNFKLQNGNINTIANVTVLTDLLSQNGLITNGFFQLINEIEIYPREYFYPKKISESEFKITANTIAIHKCSNSWMTEKERKRGSNKIWINIFRPFLRSFRRLLLFILGKNLVQSIEIRFRNLLK